MTVGRVELPVSVVADGSVKRRLEQAENKVLRYVADLYRTMEHRPSFLAVHDAVCEAFREVSREL